jgi:lambda family phage minor tail protein L
MTIISDLKSPVVPAVVELFILDMTAIGSGVQYFTPNTEANGAANVSFGGQVYLPMPIVGSGWQTSIDGSPPQPSIKISNVTKFIQTYLTDYEDLVGAKITRFMTLSKYLDSGVSPNATQKFGVSVYLIEQKIKQNKFEVEFKLKSVIDAPGFKLPRGQVLRKEFPAAGLFRK